MPALSTGIISLPSHFYYHEPKLLEQPEEWVGEGGQLPSPSLCLSVLTSAIKRNHRPKHLFATLLPCSRSDSCTSLPLSLSPPRLCSVFLTLASVLLLLALLCTGFTFSLCRPVFQLLIQVSSSSINRFCILPPKVICSLPHQWKHLLPFICPHLPGIYPSVKWVPLLWLPFALRFLGARWWAQCFTQCFPSCTL